MRDRRASIMEWRTFDDISTVSIAVADVRVSVLSYVFLNLRLACKFPGAVTGLSRPIGISVLGNIPVVPKSKLKRGK